PFLELLIVDDSKKFLDLVSQILSGNISSFSSLREFIVSNKIKVSKTEIDVLFNLIKKLYWGMFYELNFEEYKDLWKVLVVPDQKYPSMYGDLKKFLMVPNIFIALLDIHGYTSFCQKTRRNVTSLHRLDRFVEITIKNTAKKYGIMARRERGDEVILVGADVVDLLNATFDVINLFSKKISLVSIDKTDESFLPPFEISGGIVGGYSTAPLIISEKGDLQGILLNLAARLQSRANTISPNKTKIIVDYNTYYKFISSNKPKSDFVSKINFLFDGEIEFKGGSLKVYEIYYREDEKYKDLVSGYIKKLSDAISKNEWQTGVISALCDLVVVTLDNVPRFSKKIEFYNEGKLEKIEVDNDYISGIFLSIKYSVVNSKDFYSMQNKLGLAVKILDEIEEVDQIVKDYCKSVYREYLKIFYEYNSLLKKSIEANPYDFLDNNDMEVFLKFGFYKEKYESLLKKINSNSKFLNKRSTIWNMAFGNVKDRISFSIYSGKK
ncbi:MAG: hypothetical protein ACK4F9_05315, partial [Brevinematia bacterium]